MRNTLIALAICLVVAAGMYFWGFNRGKASVPPPEIIRDTIYRQDTIKVKIAAAPSYIIQKELVPIPVHDTIRERDTLFLLAERETVCYEDSTYRAVISGIEPRLDSLTLFPQTREIITTIEVPVQVRRRFGFGIQTGAGVMYDGKFHAGPYIGVGLSVNL